MAINYSHIEQVTTYKTIESTYSSEFKDRGSKFLGYAYPVSTVDDVKNKLRELKDLHPKAVHHCYAFRIGTDGNLFRAADDGEPSGSAGKPILGQIDSIGITNVLVVVVRYFGGTLLGVPGLINAYKVATHDALIQAILVERIIEKKYKLEFPYPVMNDVMRILKQHHVSILKQEMSLFCEYEIGIGLLEVKTVLEKLETLRLITNCELGIETL